jgi:hypothetical protein
LIFWFGRPSLKRPSPKKEFLSFFLRLAFWRSPESKNFRLLPAVFGFFRGFGRLWPHFGAAFLAAKRLDGG